MKTKKKTLIALLVPIVIGISSSLLALSASAQLTRLSLDTNIQNRYPDNTSGIITPFDLRNVDSNLIYSLVVKLNDTSYTALFDTISNFYEGQNVIHGQDSIYRCKVANHHGPWNNSHFRFIQTIGGIGGGLLDSVVFNASALTATRTMSFPNQSGTLIAGETSGTPGNTTTPVAWIKIWYNSNSYWIPLYQ